MHNTKDYIDMRIISDEVYAGLVKELAKNETVAVFQQLLLSPKQDETGDAEEAAESKSTGGAE